MKCPGCRRHPQSMHRPFSRSQIASFRRVFRGLRWVVPTSSFIAGKAPKINKPCWASHSRHHHVRIAGVKRVRLPVFFCLCPDYPYVGAVLVYYDVGQRKRIGAFYGANVGHKHAVIWKILFACKIQIYMLNVYALPVFLFPPDVHIAIVCMILPVAIVRPVIKGRNAYTVSSMMQIFCHNKNGVSGVIKPLKEGFSAILVHLKLCPALRVASSVRYVSMIVSALFLSARASSSASTARTSSSHAS